MGNTFPGFENVVTSIGAMHARIHQGLLYSSTIARPALAGAGVLDILVVTGSVPPHLRHQLAAGATGTVLLYEDTTVSANGVAELVQNKNRLSGRVNETTVFSGPTVTGVGTLLGNGVVPGGKTGQASGGIREGFEEWILKPASLYLIRFTNNDAQAQPVNVELDWYEPFGKLR